MEQWDESSIAALGYWCAKSQAFLFHCSDGIQLSYFLVAVFRWCKFHKSLVLVLPFDLVTLKAWSQ